MNLLSDNPDQKHNELNAKSTKDDVISEDEIEIDASCNITEDEDSQDAEIKMTRKKSSKRLIDSDDSGTEDNDEKVDNGAVNNNDLPAILTSQGFNNPVEKCSTQDNLSNAQDDVNKKLTFSDNSSSESETPSVSEFHRKKKTKKRVMKMVDSSDESGCDGGNESDVWSEKKLQIHEESDDEIDTIKNKITNVDLESGEPKADDNNDDNSDENSSSDSNSGSEDSSDDDAPPLRIFRNKDASAMNARGFDNGDDLADEGGLMDDDEDDEAYSSPSLPHKPRRRTMPSNLDIRSETQRLIRESSVNLPYFVPPTKKLSEFLKRPNGFQEEKLEKTANTQPNEVDKCKDSKSQSIEITEDLRDSGIGLVEPNKAPVDEECTDKMDTLPSLEITPTLSRKAQLLASRGVAIPPLNTQKIALTPQPGAEFVDLDDEPESPNKDITNFMQRFLKHSSAGRQSLRKKKVQFNIIRKEERADGSGVELVPDVITTKISEESSKDETDLDLCNYKTLREKLAAKMKQRRSQDRLKREEIYKLDNEEVGSEVDEEEEELDDVWSDVESDHEDEEEEEVVDKSKNHLIDDDSDEEATQPTHPDASLSNSSIASKTSQLTSKSDNLFPHLSSEGSMLLFDDTIKKQNSSREDLAGDHTFDEFYGSMIPPNQPEISDISDSSKPSKLNYDEDSYFCSERSLNISNNGSQSRIDYESQFLDSDGFIKEPKMSKSLSSLLPPGGEDDNANDCNMSQLLELCSGKFQDSGMSQQISDVDDAALIDESFGFQVEADELKATKSNSFSDGESSENEEADEGITIVRRKKDVTQKLMRNYVEEEAELSGDDVGSDDDDAENEDYYEEEANDEILPDEKILQQQVNKVHLKQLLDEDQRDIELLQEAFVDDAIELKRNRKFRWKNIDENLTQDLFHSDEETEDCHDDNKEQEQIENEESQWRMLRLEREEFLNSKTNDNDTVENDENESNLLRMGRTVIQHSRVLSEVNEDSKGTKTPTSLSRSNSVTTKLPSRNSFLSRKPEILSKFANFKESKIIKGAVNSDRMVFKAVSPGKKTSRKSKRTPESLQISKKPRLDEDSNSVFDLFDS